MVTDLVVRSVSISSTANGHFELSLKLIVDPHVLVDIGAQSIKAGMRGVDSAPEPKMGQEDQKEIWDALEDIRSAVVTNSQRIAGLFSRLYQSKTE